MNRLQSLLRQGAPLVLPGVHDALSARVVEDCGFEGLCIGGAAVGIMQFALPDLGLQSFGEYRDCVARIRAATRLPILLDAENGFGDAKVTARTVASFEQLGIDGLIIEDLVPLVAGRSIDIVPLEEISAKLQAAMRARVRSDTWIVGRTDAAHAGRHEEAATRARHFEEIGVDAVLVTGLRDFDDMLRLRDAVRLPLIALVVETKPWFAPTFEQASSAGYEIVMHAAAPMLAVVEAMRTTLTALRTGTGGAMSPHPPALSALGDLLGTRAWQAIDLAAAPR